MARDCHNGLSPVYTAIYAVIILLTHYSLLISAENIRDNPRVQFETCLFIIPQCLICATVFFGWCQISAVRALAALFLLNQFWWGIPYSNHHMLLCILSLAFLLCKSDRELRTSIIGILVVAYAFTFLYKLNTAFVDPQASCAYFFIQNTTESLLGVAAPQPLLSRGPALVLAAELAIPVLLLIPRLRPVALAIGVIFHGALALDIPKHFFDFSTLMIGLLLIVCLPLVPGVRTPRQLLLLRTALIIVLVLPMLALGRVFAPEFPLNEADLLILGALIMFLLIAGAMIYLRPLAALRLVNTHDFAPLRPLSAMPALLLVAVCLGPILGFRTRYSMDMYSGLELTATESNHLFIPRSLDLFGYLGDFALLEAADSKPFTEKIELNDSYMPFLELRRLYSKAPHAKLRFLRGDEVIEVSPQKPYPPLSTPLSFWERSLFVFRPHSIPGKERCRW